MGEEIVNRVAQSSLVVIDLEDYYPEGPRILFDINKWLYEGIVLREKEFRNFVKQHDWSQYENSYVAITCSTEAIIPAWAYMLITIHLEPFVKKSIIGSLNDLETAIYQEIIGNLDTDEFASKPLIIKGCSQKPVPENAYSMLTAKLKPVAKSIMYGEACSAVPLFKKPK